MCNEDVQLSADNILVHIEVNEYIREYTRHACICVNINTWINANVRINENKGEQNAIQKYKAITIFLDANTEVCNQIAYIHAIHPYS